MQTHGFKLKVKTCFMKKINYCSIILFCRNDILCFFFITVITLTELNSIQGCIENGGKNQNLFKNVLLGQRF